MNQLFISCECLSVCLSLDVWKGCCCCCLLLNLAIKIWITMVKIKWNKLRWDGTIGCVSIISDKNMVSPANHVVCHEGGRATERKHATTWLDNNDPFTSHFEFVSNDHHEHQRGWWWWVMIRKMIHGKPPWVSRKPPSTVRPAVLPLPSNERGLLIHHSFIHFSLRLMLLEIWIADCFGLCTSWRILEASVVSSQMVFCPFSHFFLALGSNGKRRGRWRRRKRREMPHP